MLRVSKSRWAAQFTPGSRTTLRTRASLPPSDREYTPARSADKHLPEAHCLSCSILSPAVTATGTTFWADRWRHGWEKSLAGDGFQALGSPISHRGDHEAVLHRGPESGVKNSGGARERSGHPGSIGQRIGTGRLLFISCPPTTTPNNTRLLHGEGGVVFYLTEGDAERGTPYIDR